MASTRTAATAGQLTKAQQLLRDGRLLRARDLADRILDRNPEDEGAHRLAGDVAAAEGKLDKALDRYISAARLDPTHLPTLDAVVSIGTALDEMVRVTQALELAVIADPTAGPRHRRLGEAYFSWGRLDEALGHLTLATTLDAEDAAAWATMCATLSHLERHEEAISAADRALDRNPQDGVTHSNAAISLDALGRTDEAAARRRRALEIAPDDPNVAFHTKDLTVAGADDPRIGAMQRCAADEHRDDGQRVKADITLAKLLDDAGDTASAAHHLVAANERHAALLARRSQQYDVRPARHRFAQTRASVTHERIAARPSPTDQPVPIVLFGLPRAGKTLLEARLAAATPAIVLGERPYARVLFEGIQQRSDAGVLVAIEQMAAEELAAAREESLAELFGGAPASAPALLTASPGNHETMAAFLLTDPRTVVVSCERDPRDGLLAVFQQYFPIGNAFACRADHLAEHALLLRDHAELWSEVHADRFVRAPYEDLVTDPAAVVTDILNAAELPVPDDLADRFPRSDETSVAASPSAKPDPNAPLHRAHVGLWRRWGPHLPDFYRTLADAGAIDQADHEEILALDP